MSDTNAVRCPACQAQLRLKNENLRGRKITCPKCGKAFVVPAAAAEPDDDELLAELEAADSLSDDSSGALPPMRRTAGKKNSPRGRAQRRPAWLVPGLVGGGLVAVAGIVVVIGLASGWFGIRPADNAGPAGAPQRPGDQQPPIVVESRQPAEPTSAAPLSAPTITTKVEIIKAEYGLGPNQMNVTATLRKHVADLPVIMLPAPAYGESFGGDPVPGSGKELKVEYTINGAAGAVLFTENAPIILPVPPGRAVKLEITKAEYGTGSRTKDVTEVLQKQAGDSTVISLPTPYYNATFGDPAWFESKRLSVNYRVNGQDCAAVFEENAVIDLPMPEPAAEHATRSAQGFSGNWIRGDDWLISPGEIDARYIIPDQPPEEFTVSLRVQRLTGNKSFAIGLPLQTSPKHVLATLDFQPGDISGLESIDGRRVNENGTAREGQMLPPNREALITCTLRKGSITCTCDGVTFIDWRGDFGRLAGPGSDSVADKKALFLSTQSRFLIRDVRVWPIAPPTPTEATPTEWASNDGWLVSPGNPTAFHALPDHPPEEYTVSLRARRLTGKYAFAIGLPVGEKQVLLALDAQGGTASGLELVDGKYADHNDATRQGRLLFPDREVAIQCTVRQDGITCTCDGVKIVDWKGDLRKLSLPPDFTVPDKKALFLATVGSRVAVRDIKVSSPIDLSSAPSLVAKLGPPGSPAAAQAGGAPSREVFRTADGRAQVTFPNASKPDTNSGQPFRQFAVDADGNRFVYEFHKLDREYHLFDLLQLFITLRDDAANVDGDRLTWWSWDVVDACPSMRYSVYREDAGGKWALSYLDEYRDSAIHRVIAVMRADKPSYASFNKANEFLASLEILNTAVAPEVAAKPLIMDARQLIDESQDRETWKQKVALYDGRLFELTGVVKTIKVADRWMDWAFMAPIVELEGTTPPATKPVFETFAWCCIENQEPWKLCRPGDKVTIRGQMPHFSAVMGAAGLVNCEIVRHQNHSCPTIASGDLAAEYLRGQPGFEEKYNEKLVVVEGKITKVTPLPEGDLFYAGKAWCFESAAGVTVAMQRRPLFDEFWRSVKPGDVVEVLGTVRADSGSPLGKTIWLDGSLIPRTWKLPNPMVAITADGRQRIAVTGERAEQADTEDVEMTDAETEDAEAAAARARRQLARYAPKLELPDKNQVIEARISLASRPGLVAKIDKVGPDGIVELVPPSEKLDAESIAARLMMSKGDGLAMVGNHGEDPDGMRFLRVTIIDLGSAGSAKLKVGKSAVEKIKPGEQIVVFRIDGAAAADLKKAPEIADLEDFGSTPIDAPPWSVMLAASFNNLKQIGLGLYNFESAYGSLPPASLVGPDGRPWHSWRVMLLPMLDAQETFNAYKWDEPWDGPNNRKLLDRMPAVYADPAYFALTGERDEKYYTNYVAIRGEGMAFPALELMFDGKELPREFSPVGTTFEQFRDGTDRTLLVGHVGLERKIPWMKPEDIFVTEKLPRLGQPGSFDLLPYKTDQGAVAPFLRADGRAFGIRETIDARMLHSLMTIAGGEKVNWTSVPSIGSDGLRRPDLSGPTAPFLYLVRIGKETKARLVIEAAKKRK